MYVKTKKVICKIYNDVFKYKNLKEKMSLYKPEKELIFWILIRNVSWKELAPFGSCEGESQILLMEKLNVVQWVQRVDVTNTKEAWTLWKNYR